MVEENGMVMMTERELNRITHDKDTEIESLTRRIEILQEAVMQLMKTRSTDTADTRVGKRDFLAIYDKALDDMGEHADEDNDIYGYDITVHWHGLYCNCGDGAIPSNYIISSIRDMLDEDDDEY